MLVEKYLWKQHYKDQFKDKNLAIKIYKDFNNEIINSVPSDQLLVYRIKDGWGPLCSFLNVSIPKEDFPVKNQRKEFKEQIGRMMDSGEQLVLK